MVPTIGTYIYINELFVPSLLKLVLFGNWFNYIDTVIFESAAKLVVHVPLAVKLNELFTVQGLSATNYLAGNRNQYQYIGCSKVIIIIEDGSEVDAYIVDSDDTVWTLHCTGNIELKKMPPLQRDGNNCIITNETYIYNNIEFSVLEYHPIWLVIYKNVPKIKLMMHRLVKGKRSNPTLPENIYQTPFILNEHLSS